MPPPSRCTPELAGALVPPVKLPLEVSPEHECPYLPGRKAITRAVWVGQVAPDVYHDFMNAGFRRSGHVLYQPVCRGCRACVPIRIPTDRFAPSRSQRRCRRRNGDLSLRYDLPIATQEKYQLYVRYVTRRHDGKMGDDWSSFESFLYESPTRSIECCYRDPAGRLLAVGLCDLSDRSLSSVYFYFDPAERRRGLGTFGILREIELARDLGIPWYYLGFWVIGCRSMDYKADFRPCQFLHSDGVWRDSPPG